MKKEDERKIDRAEPNALKLGDFVSWNSAGGRARGKIIKIERDPLKLFKKWFFTFSRLFYASKPFA